MAKPEQGKYTILRKIADGGMAEIFLAQMAGAKGFQKLVVIKRIRADFFQDAQTRDVLVDEAHVAMALNHSNIVQVLDLGEMDGKYFLALELVEGWSLSQLVRRAMDANVMLSTELALYLISQVCRGLAYAHSLKKDGEPLGLVHRDISPQNILVSEHGDVKLTDFGIAKVKDRTEKTAAGIVKGKIAFMSPEQAQGAPLDARSDLFSVGTVLYALVTDKLPFAAPTDLESMVRIQAAEFPPPTKWKPKLKPELVKLIMKAMRLRPADRFQNAEEMLVAVEQVMRNQYRPVGQTELKHWLDELQARDRVPPVHREATPEPSAADGKWSEVNESAIVPPTLPPQKLEAPVQKARPRRSPTKKWIGAGVTLLVVMAWIALARRGKEEPPVQEERTPIADAVPAERPKALAEPAPEISLLESSVSWDAASPEALADVPALATQTAVNDAGTDEVTDDAEEEELLSHAVDPNSAVVGEEADAGTRVGKLSETARAEPPRADRSFDAGKPAVDPSSYETVFVMVQSVPTKAVVKVGDRVFGPTPISLRFRTGVLFELTFVKSGHVTTKKLYMVTSRAGQRITAVLPKAPNRRSTRGKR